MSEGESEQPQPSQEETTQVQPEATPPQNKPKENFFEHLVKRLRPHEDKMPEHEYERTYGEPKATNPNQPENQNPPTPPKNLEH